MLRSFQIGIGDRAKGSINTSGIVRVVVLHVDHGLIVHSQSGSLLDR